MSIFRFLYLVNFVISTQNPTEMELGATGPLDLPRIISSVKNVW